MKVRTGRTVRAAVGVEDTGAFSVPRCHPAQAAGFRLFAPNAASATVIQFPSTVCSTGQSSLTIRPVR